MISAKWRLKKIYQLNQANQRFVPHQFLQLLNKESIIDVQLEIIPEDTAAQIYLKRFQQQAIAVLVD